MHSFGQADPLEKYTALDISVIISCAGQQASRDRQKSLETKKRALVYCRNTTNAEILA